MKYQPEKLNLWDRLFNRYKLEVIEEGEDSFTRYQDVGEQILKLPPKKFYRTFVKYRRIDRLTGSEKLIKEYID